MSQPSTLQHVAPSSVLYENADSTIVVVDVPRSIEEAQDEWLRRNGDLTSSSRRRLLSSQPPTTPFSTPPGTSSSNDDAGAGYSLAARLAELTARAAVDGALDALLGAGFDGPWCLPRQTEQAHSSGTVDGKADSQPFHTPPGARYIAGTIAACRDRFLAETPPFDLIVMDPPWPNRSARRRRQGRKRKSNAALDGSSTGGDDVGYDTAYNMESMRQLLEQIPVGAKLAAGGGSLVAVWVTNKAGCEAMLTDPKRGVFRGWGVELVATWTWLKVTTRGAPVVSPDSQWRRPWERLLLARRPTIGASASGGGNAAPALPTTRVIVSVPDLHSRKPSLRALLLPYILPREATAAGLEVFARNLTAGWWAWGNEVLLFQHKSWWVEDGSSETQDDASQSASPSRDNE